MVILFLEIRKLYFYIYNFVLLSLETLFLQGLFEFEKN